MSKAIEVIISAKYSRCKHRIRVNVMWELSGKGQSTQREQRLQLPKKETGAPSLRERKKMTSWWATRKFI